MKRIAPIFGSIVLVKLFGLVGLAAGLALWGIVALIVKQVSRRRAIALAQNRLETQLEHDLRHMGL